MYNRSVSIQKLAMHVRHDFQTLLVLVVLSKYSVCVFLLIDGTTGTLTNAKLLCKVKLEMSIGLYNYRLSM